MTMNYFILSYITIFLLSLFGVQADLTLQQGLKIPKSPPKGTFVLHTLVDIDTVDYSSDTGTDPRGATGLCAHKLRHSGLVQNNLLTGPCLTTVDDQTEQYIQAECRIEGSPAQHSSSYIHLRLYWNNDTNTPMADFSTQTGIGTPHYGFQNGVNSSKMYTGDDVQTFANPDQNLLFNCVSNAHGPIEK